MLYISKRRRIGAFLFIAVLIISAFYNFTSSFAATATDAQVSQAMAIFGNKPVWDTSLYPNNTAGFNAEVDKISRLSGKRAFNEKGQWLNPFVYHEYNKIIVYGNPYAEDSSEFLARPGSPTFRNGIQGEYKFIGYNEDGELLTNDHYFPKTVIERFTTYDEVNWEPVTGAEKSWIDLKPLQKEYLLETHFTDDDFKATATVTKPPLLGAFLKNGSHVEKSLVQADPGLWRGASLRLEYPPDHWNTINYAPMGCKFSGALKPVKNTYTIKADENEVLVEANISSTFEDISSLPHIKNVEFKFYNDTNNVSSGGQTYTSDKLSKSFKRNDLKVGENSINLTGTIRVYSNYGEYKDLIVEKAITINVEEATEPYAVAAMTADPKQIQFKGTNMPVKLTIGYSIDGISDISKISRVTIAIPGEGTFEATRVLSGEFIRNVTIPFSYMSGYDNRDKVYEALVTYYLTDGTSLRDDTSAAVRITTEPPEPEEPPKPENEPPEVKLNAPTEVKAGEEFYIRARASDPDGDELTYYWDIGIANGEAAGTGGNLWYAVDYINTVQDVYAEVSDGKDWDGDLATIYVKEPTVEAKIGVTGSLKENRKVILIDDSDCPKHYPIVNRYWTVTPVTESGTKATDIKHSGDWMSEKEDVLFKKTGEYKITLKVTNSEGYEDTATKTITILPDEAPIANIAAPTMVYRDKEDSGYAKIELSDSSFSIDNDYISQRIWKYKYDSDNDGSFSDETWVTLSSSNFENYYFKTKEVGIYQLQVEIKEGFGQDTLQEYITSTDYKTASAYIIVNVGNLAPVVNFNIMPKHKADFIFNIWDTNYTKEQIQSAVNSNLVPKLNAANIDYSIKVADNYDLSVVEEQVPRTIFNGSTSMTKRVVRKNYLTLKKEYSSYSYISTNSRTTKVNYYDYECIIGDWFCTKSQGHGSATMELLIVDNNGNSVALASLDTRLRQGTVDIGGEHYQRIDTSNNRLNAMTYLFINSIEIESSLLKLNATGIITYNQGVTGHGESVDTIFYYKDFIYDISMLNIEDDLIIAADCSLKEVNPTSVNYGDLSAYIEGNITNTLDNSVYLNELLDNTTFREDADKYIITISDNKLEDLETSPERENIIAKYLSNSIEYIGFGNSSNSEQFNNFILYNEGKGLFTGNTDFKSALSSLAEYAIKPKDLYNMQKYIVLNESLETQIIYSDIEEDPQYSHRILYNHIDPNCFDNPLGIMDNSGIYITDTTITFDKVGQFEVQCEARDNPKASDNRFDNYRLWSEPASTTIFVHRRPFAEPALTYYYNGNYFVLDLTDSSYDLDHTSLANKGIIQKIWSYKDATDPNAEWVIGKPTNVMPGKWYYIKLEVMDMEYTWDSKVITFFPPAEGYLSIVPEARDWDNVGLSATITYSNPSKLSKIKYQVTNSDLLPVGGWTETTLPTATVSMNTEGIYYIYAHALDTSGGVTGAIGGPYKIDLSPPQITASKTSGTCTPKAEISITATDTLSGFNRQRYAWSTGTTFPASGWTLSYESSIVTTQSNQGTYYLYVEAWDNVSNKSAIRRFGPYTIITNRPPTVQITGTTPSYVYEGDNVAIKFMVSDPDLNNLTCDIAIKKESATVWTGTKAVSPSSGVYPIVSLPAIQNISTGTYTVIVTVRDTQNETATDTYTFNTYTLGITGVVSHTELWEQNRQKYNTAARAAGREEHTPDIFFEGESFMLHADTTTIDSRSTVEALNVQVSIVGTSFSTNLHKTASTKFEKSWWEESMPRWGVRPLDFLFRVAYSNGTVKTDTVRIYISGDDYWRLRLLF